jgi:hypothetical protein
MLGEAEAERDCNPPGGAAGIDPDEGPAWVYREETDKLKLNGLNRDFTSVPCPVTASSSNLPLTVSMAFSERYLPQAQAGCRYDRMVKGSSTLPSLATFDDPSRTAVSEMTDPDPVHEPER